ncbi:MAG: glycoside hydrolase N-terminal domain-containing protein, partial [Bacteroidales bacterium]|nr:glycoside hydrolase N-terminal domain-containing protein [Bacteroidales bacterium]
MGHDTANISGYRRELDLRTGIAHTTYTINGITYNRDVFASAPGNVIVLQLNAGKEKLNAAISLKRARDAVITASGNAIQMEGQITDEDSHQAGPGGKHMRFAALLKVVNQGGKVIADGDSLRISDAGELTVYITAATDYRIDNLNTDTTLVPADICAGILEKIADRSYESLKEEHIADHQALFNRVELQLGSERRDTVATDVRLKRVKAGASDSHLVELYFQYGRYLLMGSSRTPGVLPANLQGIWNHHYSAPWNSDFHTNINLQMNYWLADVCNLSETMDPLVDFMEKITVPGRVTARKMYGCNGWTMHHNTDPYGRTGLMDGIQWGTFPMAGPWMVLHLWDHYNYTLDSAYLANTAWPVMKGSARFVLDFLSPDKKGQLVTSPSYSPENAYFLPGTRTPMQLTYAATMDIQIVRELFMACNAASEILGKDAQLADSLQQAMNKLPPTRIGANGTIMEWIEDYEEAEPGHRHISHLFGLHPGTQITPETPELFEAAAATIERRLAHGGGHTGWSRAWIINFYARLLDGEKAHEHLQALLAKSTLTNLFDTHPPFQIDGNFGGTAGIAEMLLQSHAGFIQVLPALPSAWPDGRVKGLKARGNVEVTVEWKSGKLARLTLNPLSSGKVRIVYGEHDVEVNAEKGKTYVFGAALESI